MSVLIFNLIFEPFALILLMEKTVLTSLKFQDVIVDRLITAFQFSHCQLKVDFERKLVQPPRCVDKYNQIFGSRNLMFFS